MKTTDITKAGIDELELALARVRFSITACEGVALEHIEELKRKEKQILTEIANKSKSVKILLGE